MHRKTVTVIIPTHNRREALRRALRALTGQTFPFHRFEVVVVADGCSDGTVEMARRFPAPFVLRVLERPGEGPGAARNHGASQASGQLLVFLDDDIEPTSQLLETHVQVHEQYPGHVIIGAYPPVFRTRGSFLDRVLRACSTVPSAEAAPASAGSWEAIFGPMQQAGHRYTYRDVLSGNLSIEASVFARMGGFDGTLQAHEDYELGYRLIKSNVPILYAPRAIGYHHEQSTLAGALLRKRHEGRADVMLGRRFPELLATLPLARAQAAGDPLRRIMCHLALTWPVAGDVLASSLRRMLGPLERARLRRRWREIYALLLDYWYYRGVGEETGGSRALTQFVTTAPFRAEPEDPAEIDLRLGMEACERAIDRIRPSSIRIRHGQHHVGVILPQPGAERLKSTHLRHALATSLAAPLLEALVLDGVIPSAPGDGRPALARSLKQRFARARLIGSSSEWLLEWDYWVRIEKPTQAEASRFWRRQARIEELVRKKMWVDEERYHWEAVARGYDRSFWEQQARMRELEQGKALLEEEWNALRLDAAREGRQG